MRRAGAATRGKKRRPITRRDWKSAWHRRVWVGKRPVPLFFALSAQQVKRARGADWLGAVAMLLGMLSWGVLAALLGA